MRKYFTSITFFFITSLLTAQIVTNNGADFDTAQELLDILTDNGGSGGNYSNNQNYTVTYCPDASAPAGEVVWADFTANSEIESGWDMIFDLEDSPVYK